MSTTTQSTINTALLSYGMSGRVFHAPLIHEHPGYALVGSCERSKKTIQADYPGTRSYDTVDEVIDDPSVDLVVVNTPTLTHFEFAKKALEAGKHVVVEKAFAGDANEARTLRDLAKTTGNKLAVFQNRRWDSHFLSVREILDSQVLGEIVEANLSYCRYAPDLSPKVHKEQPSSGAGIMKDLGPHIIDQALVLFGMPRALFADIAITRKQSQVDDYFDLLLLYEDKRVHLKAGYFFRKPLPEYSLFGRLGTYLKSFADVQEAQLDRGLTPVSEHYGIEAEGQEGELTVGDGAGVQVRKIAAPPGNYMAFYEQLCQSINADTDVPVSANDGVHVMQVIDMAFESSRRGRLLEL